MTEAATCTLTSASTDSPQCQVLPVGRTLFEDLKSSLWKREDFRHYMLRLWWATKNFVRCLRSTSSFIARLGFYYDLFYFICFTIITSGSSKASFLPRSIPRCLSQGQQDWKTSNDIKKRVKSRNLKESLKKVKRSEFWKKWRRQNSRKKLWKNIIWYWPLFWNKGCVFAKLGQCICASDRCSLSVCIWKLSTFWLRCVQYHHTRLIWYCKSLLTWLEKA